MENLKALVYGKELNLYQKKLAQKEFESYKTKNTEASEFIKTIAEMVGIDTDGIGHDGLELSSDDFQDAINDLRANRFC